MKLSIPLRFAAACVAALAASAAFAQAVIVAPYAPPAPRVEVMPARAGYVGPGHWHWRQGRYVWIPATGKWCASVITGCRATARAAWRWVPGHWA